MRGQNKVAKLTRQNIIDAFWDIYSKKKIENITVKEVMDRAGYNRSTFYLYFEDIYDVLYQIEEGLLPLADIHISDEAEFFTHENIRLLANEFIYQEKYFVVLFGQNGDPGFVNRFKNRMRDSIMQTMKKDEETAYLIEAVLSMDFDLLVYWFTQNRDIRLDRLLTILPQLNNIGPLTYLKQHYNSENIADRK